MITGAKGHFGRDGDDLAQGICLLNEGEFVRADFRGEQQGCTYFHRSGRRHRQVPLGMGEFADAAAEAFDNGLGSRQRLAEHSQAD